MSRLPRIAWVIPTMKVGGTELQLIHLMQGLADDFELTLYCTRTEGALIGDARRTGAYVRFCPTRSGWDPRLEPQLRRAFASHKPDILHTFLSGFDLFANRAARRAMVPIVLSSRRELPTWQSGRHRWMQRLGNGLVDGVVANSQAAANYAIEHEGLPGDLVSVIYNGIDVDHFASTSSNVILRKRFKLPTTGPVIGMVANFSAVKDHDLFIAMATLVHQKRPDAHFLLVGGGPQEDHIKRQIQQAGLKPNFTRRNSLGEIADLYALMEVSVLTSKVEGFPNVVLEALAAKRPVVAASVGGIPEVLRHEENSLLIDSRSPEDFANAVLRTLDNPGDTQARVARGYQDVFEHFQIPRMVNAYRDYYRELLIRAKVT